jgi:hypothetical protein
VTTANEKDREEKKMEEYNNIDFMQGRESWVQK